MSQKQKKGNVYKHLEEEKTLSEQIADLSSSMSNQIGDLKREFNDRFNTIHAELAGMHDLLKELNSKVELQEKQIAGLQSENLLLKEKVSDLETSADWQEQRQRNHAIRIYGLEVDPIEEKNRGHVPAAMSAVHKAIRSAIPQISEKLGCPMDVPCDYIKAAHILPSGNKNGNADPIYCVFYSNEIRNQVLLSKKIHKKNVVADLTQRRRAIIQKLISSKRFFKVWHYNGRIIKYLVNEKDTVKSVQFSEKNANDILNNLT